MRAAHQCSVSFWGTHKQTFRFEHHNAAVLQLNWNAAAELVGRADVLGLRDTARDTKLWRGVPKSSILRFFNAFKAHPTHAELAPEILVSFLEKDDPRLGKWNVGIVETKGGLLSEKELGVAGKVRLVTRARLRDRHGIADIKALMSKSDIIFDCTVKESVACRSWGELKMARLEAVGQVPLLLLYAINKEFETAKVNRSSCTIGCQDRCPWIWDCFPGVGDRRGRLCISRSETVVCRRTG